MRNATLEVLVLDLNNCWEIQGRSCCWCHCMRAPEEAGTSTSLHLSCSPTASFVSPASPAIPKPIGFRVPGPVRLDQDANVLPVCLMYCPRPNVLTHCITHCLAVYCTFHCQIYCLTEQCTVLLSNVLPHCQHTVQYPTH